VHKGSTQTNKRSKLGFKNKVAKEPKGALVWRTGLSDVPPDSVRCTRTIQLRTLHLRFLQCHSAIIHRTVRCTKRSNGSPAQRSTAQCPDSATVSGRSSTIQAFTTLHSIQEQSATLQDTNQSHRSDQSPQFNSSALGLVRGSFVFLCCSCLLGWLSFLSHFLLSSFVSEARDTNCVVVLAGSK
jgi:hypothetical protein